MIPKKSFLLELVSVRDAVTLRKVTTEESIKVNSSGGHEDLP